MLFMYFLGSSKQTCGKAGSGQTKMQLPARDADHPAGPRAFPDDPGGGL